MPACQGGAPPFRGREDRFPANGLVYSTWRAARCERSRMAQNCRRRHATFLSEERDRGARTSGLPPVREKIDHIFSSPFLRAAWKPPPCAEASASIKIENGLMEMFSQMVPYYPGLHPDLGIDPTISKVDGSYIR